MLFYCLYDCGARASDAAMLTIDNLDLGSPSSVTLLGKGSKVRRCPLWPQTASILEPLVAGRKPQEAVFISSAKQPIMRFGIRALIKRTVQKASFKEPSSSNRSVTTRNIRHTTAVHLLPSWVDMHAIRAWLDHVSIDANNIYAEVDLKMKAKAPDKGEIPSTANIAATEYLSKNPELVSFPKSF